MKSESGAEGLNPHEWRLWLVRANDRRAAWIYEFGRELLRREPKLQRLPLIGGIEQDAKPWLSLDATEQKVLRQLAECETGVESFGREINPDLLGPAAATFYPFGFNARAAYLADQEKLRESGLVEGWARPECVEGFSLAVNWQWPLSRILDAIKAELEAREARLEFLKRLPKERGEFGIAGRASWGDNLIRLGQARLLHHARSSGRKQVREWAKGWWDEARREARGSSKRSPAPVLPGEVSEKDFTKADAAVKSILRRFCHFASPRPR